MRESRGASSHRGPLEDRLERKLEDVRRQRKKVSVLRELVDQESQKLGELLRELEGLQARSRKINLEEARRTPGSSQARVRLSFREQRSRVSELDELGDSESSPSESRDSSADLWLENRWERPDHEAELARPVDFVGLFREGFRNFPGPPPPRTPPTPVDRTLPLALPDVDSDSPASLALTAEINRAPRIRLTENTNFDFLRLHLTEPGDSWLEGLDPPEDSPRLFSGLQDFPEFPFQPLTDEEQECRICFSVLEKNEKVISLHCTHTFHSSCVAPWLRIETHCPHCRGPARAPEDDSLWP